MSRPKLRLNRETLTELTTGELAAVAGGMATPPFTPVVLTLPLDGCLEQKLSIFCPSEYPSCLCVPLS